MKAEEFIKKLIEYEKSRSRAYLIRRWMRARVRLLARERERHASSD